MKKIICLTILFYTVNAISTITHINFKNEILIFSSKEEEFTLYKIDGTLIGKLQYSNYNNDIHIKNIEINKNLRRQRYGTLLLKASCEKLILNKAEKIWLILSQDKAKLVDKQKALHPLSDFYIKNGFMFESKYNNAVMVYQKLIKPIRSKL